jgi:glycosyltransferase involved in cell wall biosynthesis
VKIAIAALSAPVYLNGVSRHSANVVRGLLTRAEVSEVHLLVGAWQHRTYAEAVARVDARLHIHSVDIRRDTLSRNLWFYSELPRVAAQLDADVVHLAYPSPLSASAFRCPTVVSLHDLYPFDIPKNFGFLKGLMNRQVMRQCLKSADAIACVSASTRRQLAQWLGPRFVEKAVTIPNSVGPSLALSARGPHPLQKGRPFLLCVAQHRQNKNIPLALRVFERSLQVGALAPTAQFVILGVPGPETARIERQIRALRLERRVVILSGIKDAELQWCYRNCELLLAPSSVEGFGLPVAEALLAGCRVVCSDIPAFREVGADGCRYVALGPDEVNAFARAIREACATPRRLPMPMPWLSAAVTAEKYIMLYRQLLSRPADQNCGAPRITQMGSHDGNVDQVALDPVSIKLPR